MTAIEYAKSLGAITRKQGDKQTATMSSVGDMAKFANLLTKSGIAYREIFANKGKAIKFVFVDADVISL